MKIKEVQEYKQINFTVELDLDSIKAAITALEEMIQCEDFDADEVKGCCENIEKLAKAISDGVINI